jgi:cysteine-S-conjugate beta-lyase
MAEHHRFDDITVASLVAQGSMKWTRNPGQLAAFVAEMDFGTAPAVTEALHAATDRAQHGYLPPGLAKEMALATSEFLERRFGWSVPRSRIFATADVLSAYEVVLERFTPPGTPVIVPTPAYMPFFTITPQRGREVIQVPMVDGPEGRSDMDLEGIAKAFEAGARLLILCNPHNPLGRVYTREELLALAEVVDTHGGRVFADEIHAPITFGSHQHIPYASLNDTTAGHTVTAVSASKAWNIPGLKCAQLVISNEDDYKVFSEVAFMVSHGAATPGVIANTAAYRDGEAWLDDVLGYIDTNRTVLGELLASHLPEVRYSAPEGTYIAWLDCRGLPDVTQGASWSAFFGEHAKVGVTDGALCGEAGVGHIRLMLSTPRHILTSIVIAMAKAVRQAQSAAAETA